MGGHEVRVTVKVCVVVETMVEVVLLVEVGEEVAGRVRMLVVVWPVETDDELADRVRIVVGVISGGERVDETVTGYDVRLGVTGQLVTEVPQFVTRTVDVW